MSALSHGISELLQHPLKPRSCLSWLCLLKRNACVDVQQLDLLADMVHRLLKVRLLPVGREI